MKNKYKIKLEDKHSKFHAFEVEAENTTQAVTEAMDRAFDDMPDNSFRLNEIEGDFI